MAGKQVRKALQEAVAKKSQKQVPLSQVKSALVQQYENGWADLVVETMEDGEVEKLIAGCRTVEAALKRLKQEVGPYAEQRAEVRAAGDADVAETPQADGRPTKFVVRVRGDGMGRSRYVMPGGGLTPWRFQAEQWEAREAAEVEAAAQPHVEGVQYDVVPFRKAWFEEVPMTAAA